jgi:hypothetical protein
MTIHKQSGKSGPTTFIFPRLSRKQTDSVSSFYEIRYPDIETVRKVPLSTIIIDFLYNYGLNCKEANLAQSIV